MYFLTSTVSGPSVITGAVKCCFCSPNQQNLVVVKNCQLEIISIDISSLVLVFNAPIYGRVTALLAFRHNNEAKDWIFILTEDMSFCILSFDESRNCLLTRSSGSLNEKSARRCKDAAAQVHPSGKAICVLGYSGLLHLILIEASEETKMDVVDSSLLKKPRKNYIKNKSISSTNPDRPNSVRCSVIIVDIVTDVICFAFLETTSSYDIAYIEKTYIEGVESRNLNFCSVHLNGLSRSFSSLSSNTVSGKLLVDCNANMLVAIPYTDDGSGGGVMIISKSAVTYVQISDLNPDDDDKVVKRVNVEIFKTQYIGSSCNHCAYAPIDCVVDRAGSCSVPRLSFASSSSSSSSSDVSYRCRIAVADESSCISMIGLTIDPDSEVIRLTVARAIGRLGSNAVSCLIYLDNEIMFAAMGTCGSSFVFKLSASCIDVISGSSSLGVIRDMKLLTSQSDKQSDSLLLLNGTMYESKLSILTYGVGLECCSCLISPTAETLVQRLWYLPANKLIFLSYVNETKVLGPGNDNEATLMEYEPVNRVALQRTIRVFEISSYVVHISSSSVIVYLVANALLNDVCHYLIESASIVLADMHNDQNLILLFLSNKSIVILSLVENKLEFIKKIESNALPFDDVSSWCVYEDILMVIPWWTATDHDEGKANVFIYSLPSMQLTCQVNLIDVLSRHQGLSLDHQQVHALNIDKFSSETASFCFILLGLIDGRLISMEIGSNTLVSEDGRLNVSSIKVFQIGSEPISSFFRVSAFDLFIACGNCPSVLTCKIYDHEAGRVNVDDLERESNGLAFCRLDCRPVILMGSSEQNLNSESVSFVAPLQSLYETNSHGFLDEDVVFATKSGFVCTGNIKSPSCPFMMRNKDSVSLSNHDVYFQLSHLRMLGGNLNSNENEEVVTNVDLFSPGRIAYCQSNQVLCVCLESFGFHQTVKTAVTSSTTTSRVGGKIRFIHFPQINASGLNQSAYDPSDLTNGLCDLPDVCVFEMRLLANEEIVSIISFCLPEGLDGDGNCSDDYVVVGTMIMGNMASEGRILVFRVWNSLASMSSSSSSSSIFADCVCEHKTAGPGLALDVVIVHVNPATSTSDDNDDQRRNSCYGFPIIIFGLANSILFYQLKHQTASSKDFTLLQMCKLDNYSMILSVQAMTSHVSITSLDDSFSFKIAVGDAFRSTSCVKFSAKQPSELEVDSSSSSSVSVLPKKTKSRNRYTATLDSMVAECKLCSFADYLSTNDCDSSILSADLHGNIIGYVIQNKNETEEKEAQRSRGSTSSETKSDISTAIPRLVKAASVRLCDTVNVFLNVNKRGNDISSAQLKETSAESVVSSVFALQQSVGLHKSVYYYGTITGSIGKIVEIPSEDYVLLSAMEGAMTGRGCERIGAGFVSSVGNISTHAAYRACTDNGPMPDNECLQFVDGDVLKNFYKLSPITQALITAETLTRLQNRLDNLDSVRPEKRKRKGAADDEVKPDASRVTVPLHLTVDLLMDRLDRVLQIH